MHAYGTNCYAACRLVVVAAVPHQVCCWGAEHSCSIAEIYWGHVCTVKCVQQECTSGCNAVTFGTFISAVHVTELVNDRNRGV